MSSKLKKFYKQNEVLLTGVLSKKIRKGITTLIKGPKVDKSSLRMQEALIAKQEARVAEQASEQQAETSERKRKEEGRRRARAGRRGTGRGSLLGGLETGVTPTGQRRQLG